MALDLLTVGEALVEIMRTEVDQPLHQPALFTGPYPSGAPFIFLAQAARMGANVGGVGVIGNDAFGQCMLDQFCADGINALGVKVAEHGTTGVAFVAYNMDGSRDFVFSLGVAADLSPDMLDESLFEGLRCLHLTGSTLLMSAGNLETGRRALELALRAGAKFSFDPNYRAELMPLEQAKAAYAPFLSAADVILATDDEIQLLSDERLTDDAIHQFIGDKANRIIVIHGGKVGCRVYMADKQTSIPGFLVDEIDPTGAGDCFDAGFLVRWLDGDAPIKAARWANACGALAVTKQGPMAGAASYEVVKAFIASSE